MPLKKKMKKKLNTKIRILQITWNVFQIFRKLVKILGTLGISEEFHFPFFSLFLPESAIFPPSLMYVCHFELFRISKQDKGY